MPLQNMRAECQAVLCLICITIFCTITGIICELWWYAGFVPVSLLIIPTWMSVNAIVNCKNEDFRVHAPHIFFNLPICSGQSFRGTISSDCSWLHSSSALPHLVPSSHSDSRYSDGCVQLSSLLRYRFNEGSTGSTFSVPWRITGAV